MTEEYNKGVSDTLKALERWEFEHGLIAGEDRVKYILENIEND